MTGRGLLQFNAGLRGIVLGILLLIFPTIARSATIFDPLVFNWQFYLDPRVNPDLRAGGFNTEALAQQHWQLYGINEGRRSAPSFYVREYLARYVDLKNAFGTNYSAAVNHYLTYGHNEGRIAVSTCPSGFILRGGTCLDTGGGSGGGSVSPGMIPFKASVVSTYQGFAKFVYSFPLPANPLLRGLSGSVSIDTVGGNPSEALFVVGYVPSGNCLPNGSQYTDFGPLFAAMPGAVVTAKFIVKGFGGGNSTVSTAVKFPAPIAMKGCAFVILDGGPSLGYISPINSITMTSSIVADVATGPSTGSYVADVGDEFCFGMTWGCQLHTTSQGVAFATATKIAKTGRIKALFGDVSEGMLSAPMGNWSATNTYYVDKACAHISPGQYGPGNYMNQIPADAVRLLSFNLSGGGVALQKTVNQPLDVPVKAGDCLVHLVQVNGNGAVDAESQVSALIQP